MPIRTHSKPHTVALIASLAIAGCSMPRLQRQTDLSVAAVDSAIAAAADQVRRCYRSPRLAAPGRSISTRLRVRYASDGTLIGLPMIVSQSGVTPSNETYARRLAEAASLAVIRCVPLRLPDGSYLYGWSEFDLIFSPRGLA